VDWFSGVPELIIAVIVGAAGVGEIDGRTADGLIRRIRRCRRRRNARSARSAQAGGRIVGYLENRNLYSQ